MVSSTRVRILLIDDHALVRAGVRLLLEQHADLKVVAEIESRDYDRVNVQGSPPDVILLDMDDKNSHDILPKLLSLASGVPVLVLTGRPEGELHHEIARMGTHGLVSKSDRPDVLAAAVRKVAEGDLWFSRSLMAAMLGEMLRPTRSPQEPLPLHASLTDREREVILLLGQGLKNHEIASRLFITESTVRHHLTSIYRKLDVSDRLELVIYAFQQNLITPR